MRYRHWVAFVTGLLIVGVAAMPQASAKARTIVTTTSCTPGAHTMTRYLAGVAVGGLQPWNTERAADYKAMANANATWIRSDLAWEYLEPSPGNWQWGLYDPVVQDAKAVGLKYLAILHTVPAWANSGIGDYGIPNDTTKYTNYAYQTVKHYLQLGVNTYEIGNEVNLTHPGWAPDGAFYTTNMLIPIVDGVRQAATELGKSVTIIMGSMAPTDWDPAGVNQSTFLTDVYTTLAGVGYFDAIAWHPYTGADNPMTGAQFVPDSAALATIMSSHGDGAKKIWGTEYGQATGGSNSITEQAQAILVTQAYNTWYAQSWAGPLFWYAGRDTGTDLIDREQHFGLLRYNGSRKPAYCAFQAIAMR
jgi:hypothetical protein